MTPDTRKPLRAVAVFEALKGVIVILASLGLLALLHHDLKVFAAELVELLHLRPDGTYTHAIHEAFDRVAAFHPAVVVVGGAAYAAVRFSEAYGLWFDRAWAEWLAAVSGGLYVPFEIRHLFHTHHPGLTVAALGINVAIVGVMAYSLVMRRRRHRN